MRSGMKALASVSSACAYCSTGMTIGERLRTWRGKKTQAEVALALGVHQTTILRMEQDKWIPAADLWDRLEKLTDKAVTRRMLVEAIRARRHARTGTEG